MFLRFFESFEGSNSVDNLQFDGRQFARIAHSTVHSGALHFNFSQPELRLQNAQTAITSKPQKPFQNTSTHATNLSATKLLNHFVVTIFLMVEVLL